MSKDTEKYIYIPTNANFFDGSREIKIIQEISFRSGADEGTELYFGGTSNPVLVTDEITTFKYRHTISDMNSSSNISLAWVGAF